MRRSLTASLSLVISILAAGCSSGAAPTPQIIYVTPAPTSLAQGVTPAPATALAPTATPVLMPVATPTPEPTPTPTPTPPPKPTPIPTMTPDGVTARNEPVPLHQTHFVGDWLLKVATVNRDAWPVLKAENMFNDAPAPGTRYVMVTVTGKYTGTGSGSLFWDVSARAVGEQNVGFTDVSIVAPKQCEDLGDVFTGGSVTCNLVVFEVPSAEVSSLVAYMHAGLGDDVWYALR